MAVPPSQKRQWTVMVYFCADNDLAKHAVRNLNQMLRVGSSDDVTLLALCDLPRAGAKRYRFRGPSSTPVIERLGNPFDTGCPDNFYEFLRWGITSHPAENYFVVIWGHAAGWDELDECLTRDRQEDLGRAMLASAAGPDPETEGSPLLDAETAQALGLSFRKDFLNNYELRDVFARAAELLPDINPTKKKIDLVGFDACLMGMSEVAGQLHNSVGVLLASEAEVPVESWPYGSIFSELRRQPNLSPDELSSLVIGRYITFYSAAQEQLPKRFRLPVTLSAIDLADEKFNRLTGAIATFGHRLSDVLEGQSQECQYLHIAIRSCQQGALSYFGQSYVDLYDFCDLLDEFIEKNIKVPIKAKHIQAPLVDDVQRACREVKEAVAASVLHWGFYGRPYARSRGISIYLPSIPRCYSRLRFNYQTDRKWSGFLEKFVASSFKKVDSTPPGREPTERASE